VQLELDLDSVKQYHEERLQNGHAIINMLRAQLDILEDEKRKVLEIYGVKTLSSSLKRYVEAMQSTIWMFHIFHNVILT